MAGVLEPAQLLEMFEGNRRLTLRTVGTFEEQDLFEFAPIMPLRPFAEMVREILGMEDAYMRGVATGKFSYDAEQFKGIKTKAALLEACEAVRSKTRELWPLVTTERLLTVEDDGLAGGVQSNLARMQYLLENEIHHRGQAFVYLRMLDIAPPAFWER